VLHDLHLNCCAQREILQKSQPTISSTVDSIAAVRSETVAKQADSAVVETTTTNRKRVREDAVSHSDTTATSIASSSSIDTSVLHSTSMTATTTSGSVIRNGLRALVSYSTIPDAVPALEESVQTCGAVAFTSVDEAVNALCAVAPHALDPRSILPTPTTTAIMQRAAKRRHASARAAVAAVIEEGEVVEQDNVVDEMIHELRADVRRRAQRTAIELFAEAVMRCITISVRSSISASQATGDKRRQSASLDANLTDAVLRRIDECGDWIVEYCAPDSKGAQW
jgi:hypothetical protein